MATPGEIYEHLIKQGTPCVFPEPWRRLKCFQGFVNLGADPTGLLPQLTQTFALDDLVAAGVVAAPEQGIVTLAPSLAKHPEFVLALRKRKEELPFHLLAGNQLVSPSGCAFLAPFDDDKLQSMLAKKDADLFVVYSPEELALFWSLGLPAIPGNELTNLSGPAISEFFERLGRPRHSATQTKVGRTQKTGVERTEPLSLVLVNWAPTLLEPTASAMALETRAHLVKLEAHLGIDVDEFGVWKPNAGELETIRFCLQYGVGRDILNAMAESVENSCDALIESTLNQPLLPQNYIDAVGHWHAAENSERDQDRERLAWEQLQRSFRTELIEPLLQRAQATPDPVERHAYHLLVPMAELVNRQGLLLVSRLSKTAREQGAKAPACLPEDDFRQFLTLIDRIRAISQELQPWRKKSKVSLSMLPKAKASPSASSNLALPRKKSPT